MCTSKSILMPCIVEMDVVMKIKINCDRIQCNPGSCLINNLINIFIYWWPVVLFLDTYRCMNSIENIQICSNFTHIDTLCSSKHQPESILWFIGCIVAIHPHIHCCSFNIHVDIIYSLIRQYRNPFINNAMIHDNPGKITYWGCIVLW